MKLRHLSKRSLLHWPFALGFLCLGPVSCDEPVSAPPSTPVPSDLTFLAGGDQIGVPGTFLAQDLVVEVRDGAGEPAVGVPVTFDIVSGEGLLSPPRTDTDPKGQARTRLRLGPQVGRVRVRASVWGQNVGGDVEAHAVGIPELTVVSPDELTAGDTVDLLGQHLWSPHGSWVTFGGIRGRVVDENPQRLRAEVPTCLPEQAVQVTVGGPTGTSVARSVRVRPRRPPTPLAVGERRQLDAGDACFRMGLSPGDEVLVVVTSSASVLGPREPFVVTSVASGPGRSAGPHPLGPKQGVSFSSGVPPLGSFTPPPPSAGWQVRSQAPSDGQTVRVPVVGEERSFTVLQPDGTFRTLAAEARHVSQQAAFYVEASLPEPAMGDTAWIALGQLFDTAVWDVVTTVFGQPSDLDENGRIAVLLTSTVNGFTGQGGEGRVGGFFFGGDLVSAQAGPAQGEVLYTIAPDPSGTFGDPVTVEQVLLGLPGVLAHEFTHLVHFNERMLLLGASAPEATWLAEALAVMAEDRVAAFLEAAGNSGVGAQIAKGNFERAVGFLGAPWDVSLIIQLGTGTLSERGAGWLFLRYLTDRFGEPVLKALTQSTALGVSNVASVTGLPWTALLQDWGIALAAERTGPGFPPILEFSDSTFWSRVGGSVTPLGFLVPEWGQVSGELRPSSVAHLVLSGDHVADVALGLSAGREGWQVPAPTVSLTAIRLR